MSRWLRLLMIGCLISSLAIGCELFKKKAATETEPAVEEEAPAEEVPAE